MLHWQVRPFFVAAFGHPFNIIPRDLKRRHLKGIKLGKAKNNGGQKKCMRMGN